MLKLPSIHESRTGSRRRVPETEHPPVMPSGAVYYKHRNNNIINSSSDGKQPVVTKKLSRVKLTPKEKRKKKSIKNSSDKKVEESKPTPKISIQLDYSFLGIVDVGSLRHISPRAPLPLARKGSSQDKQTKLYSAKSVQLAGNSLRDVTHLAATLDSVIKKGACSITSLNLSQNQLSQLPESLLAMSNLRCLNLQGNNIRRQSEIESLSAFPQLRTLMTGGNPVEDIPNYKQHVINFLPGLKTLNSVSITPADREKVRNRFPPIAFGSTSY
eukprot:TRINITY_DN18416_c0_g1_i1.p1 TRINITY_DN18416_c0_g1~~TRINITY_DN18416_c0_g1_i1.p1  ORF type:complete len:271 (+),score=23.95 TRINITY_DN18416_c0_g1_i1:54-866(+)